MLTALCWAAIFGLFALGIVASDHAGYGYQTQTAGTRINQMVQGKKDHYTYVTKLSYKAGSTQHALALMRKVSETTLSAAASAAQAVIALTADPGTSSTGGIAAGDHLAVKKPDGTWHHGIVSSVSSLNITLTANVPTGGFADDARVIFYGAPGDSDHTEKTYAGLASATNNFPPDGGDAVLIRSLGVDEPVIFSSDNASNAGFLLELSAAYSRGAC